MLIGRAKPRRQTKYDFVELLYRNVLIFIAYRDAPEKILLTEGFSTSCRQTNLGFKLLLVY
jgi:hypothetical protein